VGVSLARSLSSELGQPDSQPPAGSISITNPSRRYLRVRLPLELVVEKLGSHPFERFHQSIALQPFTPAAAIPDPGNRPHDRFEARDTQLVAIQANPEPTLYTHTVRYSFQRRNNWSRQKMQFTWLSSASSRLWQFVPAVDPILEDEAAMCWMLGSPMDPPMKDALLHAPVYFNSRNKGLAGEICRRLGVQPPRPPDTSKVPNITNGTFLSSLQHYATFDPFQLYSPLRVKHDAEGRPGDADVLPTFDWESYNEPIWRLSERRYRLRGR